MRDADRTFRKICKSGSMAETVNVIVATEDYERLLAIIGDRNCPLKCGVRRHRFNVSPTEALSLASLSSRWS
jgi:hypothetical protein